MNSGIFYLIIKWEGKNASILGLAGSDDHNQAIYKHVKIIDSLKIIFKFAPLYTNISLG